MQDQPATPRKRKMAAPLQLPPHAAALWADGPLGRVPDTIVASLMPFLGPEDLVRLSGVCKTLRAFAISETLWQYHYNDRFARSKKEDSADLAVATADDGFLAPEPTELQGSSWRLAFVRRYLMETRGDAEAATSYRLLLPPIPVGSQHLVDEHLRRGLWLGAFEPLSWGSSVDAVEKMPEDAGPSSSSSSPLSPAHHRAGAVDAHWAVFCASSSIGQGATHYSYPSVIPRLHLPSLSRTSFLVNYEWPSMPFVAHGGIEDWPARKLWASPDKLAEICPEDARFSLSHRVGAGFTKGLKLKMTMKAFLRYIRTQGQGQGAGDEMPLYVFDGGFGEKAPVLLRHYSVASLRVFGDSFGASADDEAEGHGGEDYFRPMGKQHRPDFRWLVVGPQRTGAPWHTDPHGTSAWNALLCGRKRWSLYPPDRVPPGVQVQRDAGGRVVEFHAPLSASQWYLKVFPTLPLSQKPIELIQRAGDVVFIPSGWWHQVLNLDETVSVTQNYVSAANLSTVTEDLFSSSDDGDDGEGVEWSKKKDDKKTGGTMSASADDKKKSNEEAEKEEAALGYALDAQGLHSAPTAMIKNPTSLRGFSSRAVWVECLAATRPDVVDPFLRFFKGYRGELSALVGESAAILKAESAEAVKAARKQWTRAQGATRGYGGHDLGSALALQATENLASLMLTQLDLGLASDWLDGASKAGSDERGVAASCKLAEGDGACFSSLQHFSRSFGDARAWFSLLRYCVNRAKEVGAPSAFSLPEPQVSMTVVQEQPFLRLAGSINVKSLAARANPVLEVWPADDTEEAEESRVGDRSLHHALPVASGAAAMPPPHHHYHRLQQQQQHHHHHWHLAAHPYQHWPYHHGPFPLPHPSAAAAPAPATTKPSAPVVVKFFSPFATRDGDPQSLNPHHALLCWITEARVMAALGGSFRAGGHEVEVPALILAETARRVGDLFATSPSVLSALTMNAGDAAVPKKSWLSDSGLWSWPFILMSKVQKGRVCFSDARAALTRAMAAGIRRQMKAAQVATAAPFSSVSASDDDSDDGDESSDDDGEGSSGYAFPPSPFPVPQLPSLHKLQMTHPHCVAAATEMATELAAWLGPVLADFHCNTRIWKALEQVQREVAKEAGLLSTATAQKKKREKASSSSREPLELSLLRHRSKSFLALPKQLVTQVLPFSLFDDEGGVSSLLAPGAASSSSSSSRFWVHPSWSGYLLHLASLRTTALARKLHRINGSSAYGGSLPPHLMLQLEDFLPKLADIHTLLPRGVVVDTEEKKDKDKGEVQVLLPSALHVDITSENVLGDFGSKPSPSWRPSTLLDFADSMLGDPAYEIIAAHCSCFNVNPEPLKAFLASYHQARGSAGEQEKARRLAAELGSRGSSPSPSPALATRTTYSFAPMPALLDGSRRLSNFDCYRLMCLLLLHPVDGLDAVETSRPGLIASCPDFTSLARALFQ